jgi:hypothetical protein
LTETDNMNKQETLQHIHELINMQERAIFNHPAKTSNVYQKGRDAFIDGQRTVTETEWMQAMSLSLNELFVIYRYMMTSSFISAWYHLCGDKTNRDKAAHSCATLISSLGMDPIKVMSRYIEFEQLWRMYLKEEGVVPLRLRFMVIIIAIIVLAGIIMKILLLK